MMEEFPEIHPRVRLDHRVERKNESVKHWAIKAAIVDLICSHPSAVGEVETEKKTSDLIADIRCNLSKSPSGVPKKFVVEIETECSTKNRLNATVDHLRFGYDVYWVFTAEALDKRETTEEILAEYMSSPLSLGVASLANGGISLGTPVTWDEFSFPSKVLFNEIYVPTYDRWVCCYNHGDFVMDGERVTFYRPPDERVVYISRYLENGQQTLPERVTSRVRLAKRMAKGEVERVSPVRGPP